MEPTAAENKDKPITYEHAKLIEGVSYEEYRDAVGMNASGLKEMRRSAAHFYQSRYKKVEKKATEALVFGKLFHFAVLEPVLFKAKHVVQPKFDMRTNVGKNESALWDATVKPDAIVVPEKMVTPLLGMVDSILNHPRARKLLETGVRETTMWWEDKETGELCKMRPDFVTSRGHLVDLKTAKDAREEFFKRDLIKYNYHIQAAHYCEGARATGVARDNQFIFVVIEKDPPYQIAIYPAGVSVLGVGEQWRSKLMKEYAGCRKRNIWPGYNPNAKVIELPPWAEAVDPDDDEEEEEIT